MPLSCPQCGGGITPTETCQDRFNLCLFKEMEQWTYGRVHHLSVPCYMLQHNAYSRAGWLAVRELLFQFIYQGLSPDLARRRYHQKFDPSQRTESITKGAKLPGVESIIWTFTIADVRLDTPELYCADVQRWAESILADSGQLISILINKP